MHQERRRNGCRNLGAHYCITNKIPTPRTQTPKFLIYHLFPSLSLSCFFIFSFFFLVGSFRLDMATPHVTVGLLQHSVSPTWWWWWRGFRVVPCQMQRFTAALFSFAAIAMTRQPRRPKRRKEWRNITRKGEEKKMTSAGERPESRPFILVPDSFWKFVVKNRRRKKQKKKIFVKVADGYDTRWGGGVLDDIRHPVRTLHGMRETIWHDIRKCRFHGNRPRYDRQTCRLRTFSNVLTKAQICSAIRGGKLVGSFSNQNKVIRTDTRHVLTRERETSHKNKREKKKKGTGGKIEMDGLTLAMRWGDAWSLRQVAGTTSCSVPVCKRRMSRT